MTKKAAPQPWRSRIVGQGEEPAGQFLANPANWRIHPTEQRETLDGTLEEIGWIQQVIVNRRTDFAWGDERGVETLIDGHLRVNLALSRGEETPVPVVYVDLSPNEERMALATIDPIGAMAVTDQAKLDELLALLETDNEVLAGILEGMKSGGGGATEGQVDDDEAPEVEPTPHSQLGDVWLFGEGRHRLVVGDCTDPAVIGVLMDAEVADMMVTDPPYNVDMQGKNNHLNRADKKETGVSGKRNTHGLASDKLSDTDFYHFLLRFYKEAIDAVRPGGAAYVFCPNDELVNFCTAIIESGWHLSQSLVWKKNAMALSRRDYNWIHEMILYGWKPGAAHYYGGPGGATTVLEYDRPAKSEAHPTMKPVALVEHLITNSSQPGEIVLDPFGGSGTTLLAAGKTGRRARLVEIDPHYADVICRRWAAWAGEAPVNEVTGEAFPLETKEAA